MTKYRVYLVSTVETSVEVEAETGDEAVDLALEGDLPRLNVTNRDMDMGDWTTSSELFGSRFSPQDDYEVIEDD